MRIPLFDAHCDTISVIAGGGSLRENTLHLDLSRGVIYSPYAQFFAIFGIRDEEENIFENQYKKFINEIAENSDIVAFCKTAAQAEKAAAEGKCAAFLSVEGGDILECSTERLEAAHSRGLRAVNITWNIENALSGTNVQSPDRGLSDLGRSFVKKCHELGVIVDLSHISTPGFWDVIEMSDKPVMASHSNAKSVCNHSRNLDDDQFKALIQNGGVAGINLYSDFVGENPDVGAVIRHIEHFLNLGGAKNIAIGADFDGCESLPKGISGISDVSKIFYALLDRGYEKELVYDIFYNNLLRVVRTVCGI